MSVDTGWLAAFGESSAGDDGRAPVRPSSPSFRTVIGVVQPSGERLRAAVSEGPARHPSCSARTERLEGGGEAAGRHMRQGSGSVNDMVIARGLWGCNRFLLKSVTGAAEGGRPELSEDEARWFCRKKENTVASGRDSVLFE